MKKLRNILALLMVVVMLVAVMPMNVFAEGDGPFTVTVNQSENGSVKAKVGDSELAEDAKVAQGATVTLIPNADDGYELDKLTVAGTTTTDVTSAKQFTMPAANVTVTATFKITLPKAKADAKAEVDNLKNLTPEEKETEKGKIEAANTVEEVNEAKAEAIAKDADKKAKKEEEEKAEALKKAKKEAVAKVDADKYLSEKQKEQAKKDIEAAKDQAALKDVIAAINKLSGQEKDKKASETKGYNITVKTIGNGYADTDVKISEAGKIITVTAKPYSGYAVARVYYEAASGYTKNINTYYNDYYYNDYNYYHSDYIRYYSDRYDTYEEYLRAEHYSFWKNNYRYYNRFYDRYDNYYYRYLNDFRRYYSNRYDTYEEYLRAEHYEHYYNYRYLDRYDYGYYRYGYNTSDTFDMPASDVTVYVEFTDAYPYYYDDYYYYRSRRAKEAEEAKAKAEAAKKEEEEAKAKAEAEKLPQVYENKAVIAIGSNVLDKVSKNVHTVHQMDAPAYVNGGRVMLPLRYVAEALGLQVSWVPETKTVIIWDLTQRVEIPVKSNRIIVNGITYTSDVKPEIKNERTMLPIANIARALGLIDGSDIVWDQYNKQVTLTRKVLSK